MKETEILYKHILGQNIRKIRKRTGLTQDAFSEIIGIEPSSLSNIENGKSFPSAMTIIQIQKKLNVHPEAIFDIDIDKINSINENIHEKINTMDENKKKILWKMINILEF